ncbi:recombinase family protein [Streptomyces sp. 7N604]|uniref:recombinase family protein n=1 Tax=Streptomyces sp. 7N604 TaxID=3457415 RepID=UPI003FD15D11
MSDRESGAGQGLVPDERTAPVVRRIFREYLSGKGLQRIAEGLNRDEIPSPGAYGRGAPPSEAAWSKGTVRAILVNPRYADPPPAGGTDGERAVSDTIVPYEVFDQVHQTFAARRRVHHEPGTATGRQRYLLRGLLRCARCNRLMQGTRNNGEPYYRCRLPAEHATANLIDHPRNVYLRERNVLGPLTACLRTVCAPRQLLALAGDPGPGRLRALVIEAADHYAQALQEARGESLARVFRTLGLQLVYSDADNLLKVKAVLAPGRMVVRGTVEL